MKVLVTGASGFIGSTLVKQLNEKKWDVRVLLRKTSSVEGLKGLSYEIVYGSLTDFESLKRACTGIDVVIHLAGVTSAKTRSDYFKMNADGVALLVEACEQVNPTLKRFLLVSSLAAAGPSYNGVPRTERDQEQPVSWYGESKKEGELFLEKSRLRYTIIRPPAVYGPRDRGVFQFIQPISKNILPVIPPITTGEKKFSFVYVDDLCSGIIESLSSDVTLNQVYFLCEDHIYSYSEMTRLVSQCLRKKPFKITVPLWLLKALAFLGTFYGKVTHKTPMLNLDKFNELVADYWICSNEKAKKDFNYQTRWPLSKGLSKTIRWYQENSWL